ncbi:transcription elongation factor GreA [Buchananella hordeovulneris]|uniref:transcription elongation factor GreA n=1 Tax=Buchananella hordeovulneris TaxID=52770 RepID=UPI000F5FA16C|nr:transcription elongation factor GreA [Buchananella hordeovulneris]RRD42980.1 transcription elongation factor GreA [Buchananella hordeovulneris]
MTDKTWLTKEAYDRLSAELEHAKTVLRVQIADRIDAARQEGDLKENGGYHAAREEQGLNEARIAQLEALLANAEVGETPPDDGVVEPGMVVTATIGGEKMTFLLGAREAAPGVKIDVYSPDAPLGQAIMGRSKGETVKYQAPNGREIKVKIDEVKPYVQ